MDLAAQWRGRLLAEGDGYARLALANNFLGWLPKATYAVLLFS